jgi:hypothetical protein
MFEELKPKFITTRATFDMEAFFDEGRVEYSEREGYEYSGPMALALQTGGVTGTGISSPSALMQNTLDSLSQKKIAPFLSDIVLNPSPTYWAFQRSGKHVTGAELVFPLLTQEEPTGGAFWGDQVLNTAVIDSIQPANQVWRAYYQVCAIATLDIILGSGGASAIDVVKAKMQTCAASLLPKLARAVYGTAPQNTSIDIDNLPNWIGTQGNTIGGINRSTTPAWNPTTSVSNGSGPLTVVNAEKAYQSITFGYDEPDTLMLNNYDYGNFKTQFTSVSATSASLIRSIDNMSDKEPVQTSIRYHFRFNNCTVLADQYAAAGTGYMWNSKYFWMNFHNRGYFIIRPWLMASNQEVVVSRVVVVCQLTNVNPRTALSITSLT